MRPLRILFFGTYDERTHPRVRVLREGLSEAGHVVEVCNVPLGFDTAARVAVAGQPWLAAGLAVRLLGAWIRLVWRSRAANRPDAVVVGYLGQFDVHLARLLFRAPVVLDFMVALGDTVRDRGLGERSAVSRLLDWVDRRAIRAAEIVVVDTAEHLELLPDSDRDRGLVVAVGAPSAWDHRPEPTGPGPVGVIFFGLFTPLQGAPVIGEALGRLADDDRLRFTMIGHGQDLERTRSAGDRNPHVTWVDWVEADQLPRVVAEHAVCLGIFGDGPKALRVVPNKVYQGAAAGCAVVTSDTSCQREALGEGGCYVAPGRADLLAARLTELAGDRPHLDRLRTAAYRTARREYGPGPVTRPLDQRLQEITS